MTLFSLNASAFSRVPRRWPRSKPHYLFFQGYWYAWSRGRLFAVTGKPWDQEAA